GVDAAAQGTGAERADHQVGADGWDGELWDQGDPDPGGDQTVDGGLIVGAERDVGLEPGGAAGLGEHVDGGAMVDALDPVLVGELRQAQPAAAGERGGGGPGGGAGPAAGAASARVSSPWGCRWRNAATAWGIRRGLAVGKEPNRN